MDASLFGHGSGGCESLPTDANSVIAANDPLDDSLPCVESTLGSGIFWNETSPNGHDSKLINDGIIADYHSLVLSEQSSLGITFAAVLGMAYIRNRFEQCRLSTKSDEGWIQRSHVSSRYHRAPEGGLGLCWPVVV